LEFDWKVRGYLKGSSNGILLILNIHEIQSFIRRHFMKSRIVLFTSIGLSVFLLLGVVGVVSAMQSAKNPPEVAPVATTDLTQQYAAREAAYNDLITQANQRIEALNTEVAALKKNSSPVSNQPEITADKAAKIAVDATGGSEALLKMPELVNYQGNTAFEVKLEDGVVYIDAQSGNVIFNGVIPKITDQQAGQIAGQYLGGMNPKYADIKLVNLNGTQIYQVTFAGDKVYVVFIDMTGKVLKAQIYDYTGGSSGGSPSIAARGETENNDN
jgi:uncharacterized membrane protein YkoI